MALIDIDRDPSARTLRAFGPLVALFAGLVGSLLWCKLGAPTAAWIVWGAGASLAAAAVLVPAWRRALYLGWVHAFYPMGWLVSHALLAAVYYLMITPIGLCLRLFGRDPLRRRPDPEGATRWVPYRGRDESDGYLRPW